MVTAKRSRYALLISALVVFFGWQLPRASAANPKSVTFQGISLTPAIVNINIDKGTQDKYFSVRVDNNLNQSVSLAASSLDFKSLNETGGVAFIGSGASHGLANWLILPQGPIDLKPHSGQTVNIAVSNRTDLSPGGHYAALLFKRIGAGGSGPNQVDINQVVATLVFVVKTGGETYGLDTNPPTIGTAWLHLPSAVTLKLANTGNTQTVPRGSLIIYSPDGHEVRRSILNTDAGLVLPGSSRLFISQFFNSGSGWLPGRYHLTIKYSPDGNGPTKTIDMSFLYINLPLVIAIAAIIVAVFLLILRAKGLIDKRRAQKIGKKVVKKINVIFQ